MIKGEANILEWFQTNKHPYWSIHERGSANSFISTVSEEGSGSMEASEVELSDALKRLEPGIYIIRAKEKSRTDNKMIAATTFQKEGAPTATGTPAIGAMGFTNIQEFVGLKVKEALHENEIAKRDKEIAELKPKVLDNRLADLMEKYHPYLGPILQGLAGRFLGGGQQAVAMSGWNNSPAAQPTNTTAPQSAGNASGEATTEEVNPIAQQCVDQLNAWVAFEKPEVMLAMLKALVKGSSTDPQDASYLIFRNMILQNQGNNASATEN